MNLFERTLSLWAQTNWIKTIQKEQRKLERLLDAVERKKYVVNSLKKEYLKRYPKQPAEGD